MHLDLHALGTTALQVLADLSPALPRHIPEEAHTSASSPDGQQAEVLHRLWALCQCWARYWEEASFFWRRLFDAYRRREGLDLSAVKAEYRRDAVHEKIGEGLRALRVALQDACEACQNSAAADAGLEGAPPLLHALLAMISSGEDS